jgi:hypothetical protein
MASRAPAYDATPLDVLLASVPSLPRPILARLTARMIERLDELDHEAVLPVEDEYRFSTSFPQRRLRFGRAGEAHVVAIKLGRDVSLRRTQ